MIKKDPNTGLKRYTITYVEREYFSVDIFAESQAHAERLAQKTSLECSELHPNDMCQNEQDRRAVVATAVYHHGDATEPVDLWQESQSIGYVEIDVDNVTEG